MVYYYLNCIVCGCGWGGKVFSDLNLIKENIPNENFFYEFPEHIADFATDSGKISATTADKINKSLKFLEIHEWMKDTVAISSDGLIDVLLDMETTDSYKIFDKNGKEYFFYSWNMDRDNYREKVYIMHRICYKLLEKEGYDLSHESFLKIDDIQPKGRIKLTDGNINNNRFKMDYGIADKYIGEYGVFYQHCAYIVVPYLLQSPLTNKENANRIIKFKFPLKKIIRQKRNKSKKK